MSAIPTAASPAASLVSEVDQLLQRLGVPRAAYTGGSLPVRSPITGEAIGAVAQASPADSRVLIRWDAEPPWVVIDVRDAGPGFAPDALERVFSPFFTTKPDGTGLGLAIAKRIVEAHDGTIAVRNDESGGARVSLRLPLAA